MRRFTSLTVACLFLTSWTSSGFAGDGPFSRLAARIGEIGTAPVRAMQRAFGEDEQPALAYVQPADSYYGYAQQAPADAYYGYAQQAPADAAYGYAQQAPADAAPTATYGGDPYGFAGILNRIRAAAGLHPLQYDPSLSSWASQNNAAQSNRGIGHHVNPNCYQNCGWNYTNASDAANGWLNSPGHRQNMLASNVSSFGIAYGPGPYWTLNLR